LFASFQTMTVAFPPTSVHSSLDEDDNATSNKSTSYTRVRRSVSPPPSLLCLSDDVLVRILQLLHGSTATGSMSVLKGRTLENSAESLSLANTCSRLRALFLSSVAGLEIDWHDFGGSGVLSLFAPRLRHLTVTRHVQSPLFVHVLAEASAPLQSLRLAACQVNYDALAEALSARMRTSLISFSLFFTSACPGCSGVGLTLSALSLCTALRDLALHGIEDVTHDSLLRVLSKSPDLRSLSLGFLRHSSLGPRTIASIPAACAQLASLTLHDVRWAPTDDTVTLCTAISQSLRILSLECSFGDELLLQVVNACSNLVSLSCSGSFCMVSAAGYVAAVKILGAGLLSLDVHETAAVCDEDVLSIVSNAPRLRMLRLRGAWRVSDVGVSHVVSALRNTIEMLDITGCGYSNAALYELGQASAPNLQVLHIGTRRARSVIEYGTLMEVRQPPEPVSNAAIEELLRGCGSTLRRFQYEGNREVSSGGNYAGGAFSVAGVARSLATHCPNLEVLSLLCICPKLRQRVDRARLELAIIELEENAKACVVYLDREAPPFDSFKWTDSVLQ
jgi:hypothetical protein